MTQVHKVIQLDQDLVLSKDGKDDLHYPKGTLLKVLMILNKHMIVSDEEMHSFVLDEKDKNTIWSFV